MSGSGTQSWVSYAGDDGEAWKCLLLVRALNRSLTTRPLVVILSNDVSLDMGRRLQGEVGWVFWTSPVQGLAFRSVAKRVANELPQLNHFVFLDCDCLPLKNCDDLFHAHGVQWVGQKKNVTAVFVKSRTISAKNAKILTELVVEQENPGMTPECNAVMALVEMDYCLEVDVMSSHPTKLGGKDGKMICFFNGHPLPQRDQITSSVEFQGRGRMENEIFQLCVSLCPELFPKIVNSDPSRKIGTLPARELNDSIAIIGMACRYPCANTPEEFWTLLEGGLDGIRKVPEDRWTKETTFIRLDNVRNVEAGFLSCPIDHFDAGFFNTNAADMAYLDPQQHLSLRVVWEALENAGIDPNTLKNTLTGVFGGWWRNDYKEMLQCVGSLETDFLRGYMGNALGPMTARISHFFELIGPSISTESGCSTSIAGVDMACARLRNEDCKLAIAVAANLLLHPFAPGLMEGLLAQDGRCKTYDASADGFGRAEGIGVLILKRFGDAVADGDRIWGLVRGSAIVQEGTSRSMGTPTVDVEAKAMTLALQRASVDPDDVEFVETHGTGTPIGDPIEIAAVAKAYSSGTRGKNNVLTIGSVKTNIGHTESVCGIAGIQKSILAMDHELIPKHLHLKTLNPEIDLESIPAQLPLESMPWKRRKGGKPRIAGINSFGITGAQAHILVQEPPEPEHIPSHRFSFTDSRSMKMLTFSAKTEEAFRAQVNAYSDLLKEDNFSLKDIEYSMHTGRSHFPLRQVALGSTKVDLLKSLEDIKAKQIPNMQPKLCFLFTGQGSQYPQMAKALYEQSVVFQTSFDWCDSILRKEHGISLKPALWDPNHESLLKTSLYSQTSIFVVEYCLFRLWDSWGIKPNAVLGHSLGEFAASVVAEMISAEDAIKLVVTRSKLIETLPNSNMLVVGASLRDVQHNLDRAFANQKKWLDVAAVNSESQTVVSGSTELIQEFKTYCDNNKLKTHILDASHAFHSRLMDPMLEEYEAVAKTIRCKQPSKSCTYISGVDGKVMTTKPDAKYWIRHTRERVRFLEASHTAVREGQSLFLEIGPHPVLSTLLMTNVDEIADVTATSSLRKKCDDWETMLSSLGKLYSLGLPINWENFHRYTGGKTVKLPGYHFKDTKHWLEIKDQGSTPFHPLLGSFIPNASDVTIFKNSVNVHHLPFLKDHALGDKIIFPCVGYVDMIITAGYAATLCSEGNYVKPTSPLCIRNFSIITPVCLSEMQPTEFQVVVSKGLNGEISGTIFTKVFLEESNYKWVRNATATFTNSPPPLPDSATLDLAAIKTRCSTKLREGFDYKELEEFGFNFGPSLQMVTTGWRDSADQNSSTEWLFPFTTHETQEDLDRFIIHPWIVDPMLQTQIQATGLLDEKHVRKRLVVPVSIDNYTWWGHSAPKGYIYIRHKETGNEAHLFDDNGKLMVSMLGTEFMETTLSNILSLIDSQKNPYPSMAEFIWREKLGPEERRIPDSERGSIRLQDYAKVDHAAYTTCTSEEAGFYESFKQLTGFFMLRAMKELGLDKYDDIQWPGIVDKLGVLPVLDKFLRYILVELVADGWLEQIGESGFKLKKPFPEMTVIKNQIDALLARMQGQTVGKIDLDCVIPLGSVLAQILTGTQSALPLLYPDMGNVRGPAELYYTESVDAIKRYSMSHVDHAFFSRLAQIGTKSVVRVLEVGAGVGSTTSHHIKYMMEAGVSHFEYTYTDISPAFLQIGEQLFEETGISAKFALLNVEKDPLGQGFIPEHYDVIVASWVLHATKDIEESVLNLRKLLKPGGYVFINELIAPTRGINLLFGGLEGFWRFEDVALRPWHCELSVEKWAQVLEKVGFEDFISFQGYAGVDALFLAKLKPDTTRFSGATKAQEKKIPTENVATATWVVFGDDGFATGEMVRRLEDTNHVVKMVTRRMIKGDTEDKISTLLRKRSADTCLKLEGIIYLWGLDMEKTTTQVCEPFLYICKYLAKLQIQGSLKLLVLTQGNMCTGPSDFYQSKPSASPLVAMVNVIANENPDLTCKCVDIDASPTASLRTSIAEAFAELFTSDADIMVAYRRSQRCIQRLRPYKVKSSPLPIPRTPRFRLLLPPSHLIQDLQFVPAEPEPIGEKEVEIEVKAYALNFLDVFMVTKPDPVFDKYNYLGIDIAGVVTAVGPGCEKKIGDRVILIRRGGLAMPTHLVSPDHRTLKIPDDVTFAEAATYPMGILTVASCLVDTAQAKEGDVVLIHTASGGVGILAIEIAQRLGCTIVATAGNERKRNFLRNMGLKHVFNSRTTEYQADIRKALGGRGVTVVLNSLTGAGFKEATLAVCEQGARFIEMSKMNIWSKEEVKKLRPDVYYEVVDVSTHPEEEVNHLTDFLADMLLAKKEDRPKPLPYTRFDASEIRDALEFMEKVKHVGKIVLTMPEIGQAGAEPFFPLFNDQSTYMITGGLGGIGLEVAKWMGSVGAKTLLLVGRSPPKADALEKIDQLRQQGVNVEIRSCDVGDMDQLKALVAECDSGSLPPLRGIMHAAGVLADATYEHQSWDKYEEVFHCKVKAAWNLHQLSLVRPYPLEHFVLFSSMTVTLGSPAQSNYVAANYYMDQLVHYRNSLGLPGTTINWGQWGQVGLAANLHVAMNKPLTIHQGLAALEHVIKSHKTQVMAHETDLPGVKMVLTSTKGLLADIEEDSSQGTNEIDGDEFWREYDGVESSNREKRYDVVRKFLKRLIRITLKMDKNEEIDDQVNFQDMGMDSLMMVEMKNGLQASIGKRVKVSIAALKDCKTVEQLTARLVELISGREEIKPLSPEELIALIAEDSVLPDEINLDGLTVQELKKLSNISTILITGCTGTLGPYVMIELMKQHPGIQKIYCLMRENKFITPEERFRKALTAKNLLQFIDMEKIHFIVGDVSQENLGMTPTSYNVLGEEVDAIVHLAVRAGMDEFYNKSPDPNHCRNANVGGMKNILGFAVHGQLKHFYHASTMIAETQVDEDNRFWEDWPVEGEFDGAPDTGYSISKFICDRLASQAVARGVPIKAFRFPNVGGDTTTGGNVQIFDSQLMMRMLGYMHLGYMPALNLPMSILPVDLCAAFSVKLFLNEETGYEMFNVGNPQVFDERKFPEIAKQFFGVKISVLEPAEFKAKVESLDSTSDPLADMAKVAVAREPMSKWIEEGVDLPEFYIRWLQGEKNLLMSKKCCKYLANEYPSKIVSSVEVLKKDLQYAKDTGVFEKLGITCKKMDLYLLN